MAALEIDGKTYAAEAGENLLKTVLSLGLDLPYFCWHPALGSVGACRQCAVLQYKDADDHQGRLVMACMTPVANGMRIGLKAPEATQFRADIVELLMTNHPHDCPVCEEGGECHLQDMTVMTGHTSRVYRNLKRTHRNQYLGPFINHEMNRCIACYRCVRYYQDYAGGEDLGVFATNHNVYFGRHEDGVLENEFSGNLVEVCPTGVFTDKTFSAHYARKWDLQAAPSICPHCALGCNISPAERYGELRRVTNRYHGDINGYFLCDRGRFGYDFVNSDKRLRKALIKGQQAINQKAALEHFKTLLKEGKTPLGIGSPRASIEANFALRELVGSDNFYLGFSAQEQELLLLVTELLHQAPAAIATLREVEQADAVVILGEDITNTAPRLALSVRQAVRNRALEIAAQLRIPVWQDAAVREAAQQQRSPLFIAASGTTRLDNIASEIYRGSPDALARMAFAIAHELNATAPAVDDLSKQEKNQVKAIAKVLRVAKRPLVITGTGSHSRAVIEAAVNLVKALPGKDKALSLQVPECNSIGLALLGGENYFAAAEKLKTGDADTVIVLENDLYRRGEHKQVKNFLSVIPHLVVIDHITQPGMERAELVLPAASFAECEGTLISSEGRAQRFFSVLPPDDNIPASWCWFSAVDDGLSWQHPDEITAACSAAVPQLATIVDAAPAAGARFSGMKIPRQPHRYSGRTAMLADVNVSEPKQAEDPDSALAYSMEGAATERPPALNPIVWAPSWNSNQAVNKFQDEISGHLKGGDPGIRLFNSITDVAWNMSIPAASATKKGAITAVPFYQIFGSEELSMLSAPMLERAPVPYVAIAPQQAEMRSLQQGDEVEIKCCGDRFRLPVKIDVDLPEHLAGLPSGFPGMATLALPAKITFKK